jgi:hypothetical protein
LPYLNIYGSVDRTSESLSDTFGSMAVVFNSVANVYGAKYLMDRDVVFVTFNYRLGMLGSCIFLTATVAVIS